MIKHLWDKRDAEVQTCKACWLMRRHTQSGGRQVPEYSVNGKVWSPVRPDCTPPDGGVPEASEPVTTPVTTRDGGQVYDVNMKKADGYYFKAGVAFENAQKGYIKVEVFALPLGVPWDGVLYLHPKTRTS